MLRPNADEDGEATADEPDAGAGEPIGLAAGMAGKDDGGGAPKKTFSKGEE